MSLSYRDFMSVRRRNDVLPTRPASPVGSIHITSIGAFVVGPDGKFAPRPAKRR